MVVNIKAFMFCFFYILLASILQFVFFADEIVFPVTNQPASEGLDIPVIDVIIDFFNWVWSGLQTIWNMLTFNIPEIPFYARLIFVIPLWACLLYLLLPVLSKLIEAVGNLIPFT